MNKFSIIVVIVFFPFLSFTQSFQGNISGSLGIINPKVRCQYEIPVKERFSTGVNFNVYLFDYPGVTVEPFYRLFRRTNIKGFFGQFKIIYGKLTIDNHEEYYDAFGLGINFGWKFLWNHFTFEPLSGLRYFRSPKLVEALANENVEGHVDAGWFIKRSLPLDLQIKFGYQF